MAETKPKPDADSAEVARLRAENEALRAQLADQGTVRPEPTEPSYGLSEGQRADLEATGKTVSPFTGARQVGTGKPGEMPEVVDQDEYDKRPAK